jgi:hypothetical protein
MSIFFNIDDLKNKPAPAESSESKILRDRFINLHESRIEGLRDLIGKLPGKDDIIFLWTVNSFNAFTFIPYLIRQHKYIDELVVTSYAINQRIIDAFLKLLEKKLIGSATIMISDTIISRNPKVADYLKHAATGHDNFNVQFAWNHSKITLARCKDDFYVVEGSGNWSENARHEQYIFLNSQKVYDFRKNHITTNVAPSSAGANNII